MHQHRPIAVKDAKAKSGNKRLHSIAVRKANFMRDSHCLKPGSCDRNAILPNVEVDWPPIYMSKSTQPHAALQPALQLPAPERIHRW